MATTDVILTARVMPAPARPGASDVARFVRYVLYRDIHPECPQARDVDGLARYVSYRDRASPEGRLFDADRTIGDEERRDFTRYVSRSVADETRSYRACDSRAGG